MKSYALSHLPVEVDYKKISHAPIHPFEFIQKAHHPSTGAVVLFSGEVRSNSTKEVDYLEYEVHETLAENIISEILADAKQKWNLPIALCVHRAGKVQVCESAVIVITASKHRKEAYEANQYIIHRVKHEAPIWKREFFKDGTSEWGHNCSCSTT